MAITADQVSERTRAFGPRRAQRPAVTWLLIALLVALVGAIAWKGTTVVEQRTAADRNTEIIGVTKDVVASLVNLDYNRTDADLARIKAMSAGQFADQFSQVSSSMGQVLGQGKVQSTGSVKEAAIISVDDSHAKVLAAVTSVVKNTEAPEGQPRVYRMRVQLDRADDKWLVSNVEFVA
ncbi:hypothetical protein HH308_29005 [Gordonia sp. TBRC 11910]|uniref:Mce-associated membrane protein n=1 Tax=Gordonia asplenii TaxID=2725283 RepID=A0A848L8H6_9ACTN|nr:hypothetical protein [Gordonia asplenii]NMO05265.1 hypothetical protein [Gordonia asplenii]